MAGEHSTGGAVLKTYWPTGITTLAGLLIGAFLGWALYEIPFGMAAGLAVGVGIDSLLNNRLNPRPEKAESLVSAPDDH
jgi:hypothetical protein